MSEEGERRKTEEAQDEVGRKKREEEKKKQKRRESVDKVETCSSPHSRTGGNSFAMESPTSFPVPGSSNRSPVIASNNSQPVQPNRSRLYILCCSVCIWVPLEEIRSWGESFDRLMKHQAGRRVFSEFLRHEYSEENMLFWVACEELKNETDVVRVSEKVRVIYEDYVSILSPKEVSLDARVRELINQRITKPSPDIFKEAQAQIYILMQRDSYPRFVVSPIFYKVANFKNKKKKVKRQGSKTA
ncbi:unnamed protein product [Darwinula stevensoni]|uniref:RGS domain-containing protein n=1 Tax=Darwinula stevensoni TaxID=69355 RepID=A0A7R8X7P4_9CRUS|nr:unnamed protein product [Darwinula stevensoni]CAG0889306.1 unnamed protein product [Darwinula stevensoni]